MKDYDVIVVGGGFAGVAAAVSAAREGVSVLLVERYGFLGGAAVNSQVNPFMNYTLLKNGENQLVNAGIFKMILDRLDEIEALHKNRHTFNEELLKLVLDRLVTENNVDVLFHSYLIDAKVENGNIRSITVANKSGNTELMSRYFIDCSGDADLSALSGSGYQLGRELDNLCQPMTLCFRIGNIDIKKYETAKSKITPLYKQFQKEGKIKNPRENVLIFTHVSEGVLHFNSTRIIKRNPIKSDDISMAEMQAREQMYELYQFLKNNIDGFENSVLLMSAPQIGVRESRMIKGEYTITVDDLMLCKKFEDSIARGNYCVDIHNPDGSGTVIKNIPEGEHYTIPYRALIPKGIHNLITAGRCISSTHEAQSAYRIIPICCCIGEAAGIGAAVALKENSKPIDTDVKIIQNILKKNNALF